MTTMLRKASTLECCHSLKVCLALLPVASSSLREMSMRGLRGTWGGNTFSDNVSVSQEIIMMAMMLTAKPIDDVNHIGYIMTLIIPSGNREPFHGSSNAFLIRIELAEPVLWNLIIVTMMIMMIMMIMRIML